MPICRLKGTKSRLGGNMPASAARSAGPRRAGGGALRASPARTTLDRRRAPIRRLLHPYEAQSAAQREALRGCRFSDVHRRSRSVEGALADVVAEVGWLVELTGMTAVAMSPKAGAHGNLPA